MEFKFQFFLFSFFKYALQLGGHYRHTELLFIFFLGFYPGGSWIRVAGIEFQLLTTWPTWIKIQSLSIFKIQLYLILFLD